MTLPVAADVLSRLKAVLGPDGWSQDPDRLGPKLVEWRDRWSGTTPLLVLPRTTEEVAAIVGLCAETQTPITPQGGNTGLVAGQIPQGEILLSLERLRAIRAVAFAAVKTPADAVALLKLAKDESGGAVETFELIARIGIEFVLRHVPGAREPLGEAWPWYVLIEIASAEAGAAEAALERVLAAGLERELVLDAAIAQNQAQARAFWSLREHQSAAQKPEGAVWKHDVSIPISKIAAFIDEATQAMQRFAPGARVLAFGHVGDGNIHYDVLQPQGGDGAAHTARREEGAHVVHEIVAKYAGSISAEHGLGAMKTAEALLYKSPVEVEALRAIRRALDPNRIMNPRVLF